MSSEGDDHGPTKRNRRVPEDGSVGMRNRWKHSANRLATLNIRLESFRLEPYVQLWYKSDHVSKSAHPKFNIEPAEVKLE